MHDFLPRLLGNSQLSPSLMLAGLGVAFVLGAVHALSPGHGKTLVAAYLVGSRGTIKHAITLGAVVTFTHTISVFVLGLGTLFLSRYIMPEKIIPVLATISGVAMVILGGRLAWKRWRALQHARAHERGIAHHHHHDHHDHDHHHDHGHHHDHHHHDHHHHHGPGGHTHMPEGDVTMGSLIALGASGGLVPCESAMVLLLSSISLGHVAAGLVLLVAFSLGLAGVLMAIGAVVIYAKHWLPDPEKSSKHPVLRLVPVLSAAVIAVLGVLMTGVALGWLKIGWLAS